MESPFVNSDEDFLDYASEANGEGVALNDAL